MTNTNANIKDNSGQGSAPIDFAKAGQSVYFVHHTRNKLIRLFYDANTDSHTDEDLMTLHPNIASAGIRRVTMVRQPETRVFLVLDDGTALVFLHDKSEEVAGWCRMVSPGLIEDVVSLPGLSEDCVYFVINHSGTRTLEKLSLFSETRPHDSHVRYTSTTTTISGLPAHLEGLSVAVWADGEDRGDYSVTSGSITVPEAYSVATVGLRYTADYKSNKLSNYTSYSSTLRRARIVDLGILASNLYSSGLSFGPDVNNLRPMRPHNSTEYDEEAVPFDGSYSTDSRVYIRATAPVTIKALVYGVKEAQHKDTKER